MRATRSASKKQSHHFVQQQTGINKLPAEILSEIFMFCDRIWSPDIKEGEFPLQARIPTICRRWRKVALDTPALWSRITFSELSEYSRAALFLSRSGSTIPLDIKISMTGPRWDETGPWKELKQQAKEALKFIVSHGGVASRWRRLWIQTNIYHVYLAAMDFLRKSQMTSLEHLEMIFSSPSGGQGVDHDLYYGIIKAPPRLLFNKCDLPLQLRTVKLAAIPTPYLFGHTSHPQLVNLTHLELQFIGFRPSLEDMRKMLAASGSTLVVLCLSSGEIKESYPEPPSEASNGELARTPLPKLQALSFTNIQYPKWELGVLKLLDAPDLKVLRIRDSGYYFGSNEYHSQMMDLLANGPDKKHPKAYFPTVTHLSYERSGTADKEKEKDLRTLLSGCPGINSLSLPSASRLTVLLEKPLLAPELVRLRVRADVMVLKKVASARHRAGIPLKVVELHGPYSFKDPTLPSRDLKLLEKYIETITMSEVDCRRSADPTDW